MSVSGFEPGTDGFNAQPKLRENRLSFLRGEEEVQRHVSKDIFFL
jgi:hypothetical protein